MQRSKNGNDSARSTMMLDPYTVQEPPLTYTSYPEQTQMEDQPLPGQAPLSPAIPPSHPTRPSGRVRKGALLALTLLLTAGCGVVLFAAGQFTRTSTWATRATPAPPPTAASPHPATPLIQDPAPDAPLRQT